MSKDIDRAIEILNSKYHIEGPLKIVRDELEAREIATAALEELKKYKNLEEQGRLMILPVADKADIYVPDYKSKTIYKARLEHHNTKIKNGACKMVVIVPDHMGMLVFFTEEDIGLKVFLTQEEAERALEEIK